MGSERTSSLLKTVSKEPYNAETPLPALLEPVTETDLVYVRNHFVAPAITLPEWTLVVEGSANKTRNFSYSEITDLPSKTITMTLECAGNGRKSMKPVPAGTRWGYGAVSVVEFTGTPVSHLLDQVDLGNQAIEVIFHGADRGKVEPGRSEAYVRSLPLELAQHPDTLLAWEMNGQPLSPNHGFPLRLVLPGWYGMASVKWLSKIEISADSFAGFFQNEHYVYFEEEGTPEGEPVRHMRVRSLILEVAKQPQGEITVEGIAWTGTGSIARVEISLGGGEDWLKADLEPATTRYGAQHWRCNIPASKVTGTSVVSRATDTEGNTQPAAHRWNRLGYGNNGVHAVQIEPVEADQA